MLGHCSLICCATAAHFKCLYNLQQNAQPESAVVSEFLQSEMNTCIHVVRSNILYSFPVPQSRVQLATGFIPTVILLRMDLDLSEK